MSSKTANRVVITPADIQEYRQVIERLAAEGVSQRISNGIPVHASILLETMFKHADSEMRIYSGELSPKTYDRDELILAARRFLGRPGRRLRVLLQKGATDLKDRKFIRAISDLGASCGTLEVRSARGVYETDAAKHFAVMDERGYRFEIDHAETRAVANFNEPVIAQELVSAFDRAF